MNAWHDFKRETPPPIKQEYLCAWSPDGSSEHWFYETLTYWPDGTWTDNHEKEIGEDDHPPMFWASIEPPTTQHRPSAKILALIELAENIKTKPPEAAAATVLIDKTRLLRGIANALNNIQSELNEATYLLEPENLFSKICQKMQFLANEITGESFASDFCTAALANAIATDPTEGQQP